MDVLRSPAVTCQLIRCDIGANSYALDRAVVLGIQRTDRVRFQTQFDNANSSARMPRLENPNGLIGWLSDGVREIPILSLVRILSETRDNPAGDLQENYQAASARVVLFNPSTSSANEQSAKSMSPWGLLVDRVSTLVDISKERIHPIPAIINDSSSIFGGLVRLDHQVLPVLAPERINPFCKPSPDGRVQEGLWSPISGGLGDKALWASTIPSNWPGNGQTRGRQIVVFSLNDLKDQERPVSFGLSVSQVPEIVDRLPVVAMPAGPDFVKGLVFWRGLPVPVLDLVARMGFSGLRNPDRDATSRLLIARHVLKREKVVSSGRDSMASPKSDPDFRLLVAAFEIRPNVRILKFPIKSEPSKRLLPFNSQLIRGQVELEAETLVIPDLQAVLESQ